MPSLLVDSSHPAFRTALHLRANVLHSSRAPSLAPQLLPPQAELHLGNNLPTALVCERASYLRCAIVRVCGLYSRLCETSWAKLRT